MSLPDDYYKVSRDPDQSPKSIAHWVASCANLATIMQHAVDHKPGSISKPRHRNFDHSLASVVSIYRPMAELATRGAMVERGHIDMDEIDLGWIMAEGILDENNWHGKKLRNLGKILLFSPLATASGYLFSELDRIDDPFEFDSLLEYTELIIENTTPEDTVNFYKAVVENQLPISELIHNPNYSLPEEVEKILEDELTLRDMFDYNRQKSVIFEEVSINYARTSQEGISAFLEVINEGLPFQDAIAHSYITLLALIPDSSIYQEFGRITSQQLQNEAKEIIDLGGVLTRDGKEKLAMMDKKLDQLDNHLSPVTIDDLTATVTFMATLAGFRP